MAKAKKTAESEEGRKINLSKREVKVLSMNYSPERAGNELVEKVDLGFEILLEAEDLDQILDSQTDPASTLLFDAEGNPALTQALHIPVDLQALGKLTLLRKTSKEALVFKDATLKKPQLTLMFGAKAAMKCQVRVSPAGHLDDLGQLVIDKAALFTFSGTAEPDPEDDSQGQLPV